MAKPSEAVLQQFCHQAYQELKGLWPSIHFDELKFGPLDPYGMSEKWLWFCGNAYLRSTDLRYVCFAEINYSPAGVITSYTPFLSTFSHNSYLDLAFIRLISKALKRNPNDNFFRRDRPPPTWLMK